METRYQKMVCFQVYGKRYFDLSFADQAKVNTYINTAGYLLIENHPELIRDNFGKILRSAGVSGVELEEEE